MNISEANGLAALVAQLYPSQVTPAQIAEMQRTFETFEDVKLIERQIRAYWERQAAFAFSELRTRCLDAIRSVNYKSPAAQSAIVAELVAKGLADARENVLRLSKSERDRLKTEILEENPDLAPLLAASDVETSKCWIGLIDEKLKECEKNKPSQVAGAKA